MIHDVEICARILPFFERRKSHSLNILFVFSSHYLVSPKQLLYLSYKQCVSDVRSKK